MRMGLMLSLLGVSLGWAAVDLSGWGLVLLWPTTSLAVMAACYFGLGPGPLGKRPDGDLGLGSYLVFGPYFAYAWTLWHLLRLIRRERAWDEVAPGIIVGRRALKGELPPGVGIVVDLTAEFREPHAVREGRHYLSHPILDAAAPHDRAAFLDLVSELSTREGLIYIHCAEGHGRTGTLAAALLLARGLTGSLQEALTQLKRGRPRIRLHHTQFAALTELEERLATGSTPRDTAPGS